MTMIVHAFLAFYRPTTSADEGDISQDPGVIITVHTNSPVEPVCIGFARTMICSSRNLDILLYAFRYEGRDTN
jgi:hypothetical protein